MNYPKLQTYELWGKRSPQRLISEGGYHFPRILLCYKKRVCFLTTIGSILLSWHVYKTCVLLRGVFSLQIIPKQSFLFFFCRFFTHERVEHCKHLIFVEFRQCLSLALSFGSIASYLCLEFFFPFFFVIILSSKLVALVFFTSVTKWDVFFFKGESAFQRTGSGSIWIYLENTLLRVARKEVTPFVLLSIENCRKKLNDFFLYFISLWLSFIF